MQYQGSQPGDIISRRRSSASNTLTSTSTSTSEKDTLTISYLEGRIRTLLADISKYEVRSKAEFV